MNQHIESITFDIYIFITIIGSILLLVNYWSLRISASLQSVHRHWDCSLDIFIIVLYSSQIK